MIPLNKQVRIYFNLHKKKLSVKTKVNGVWKVVCHPENAYVTNASFKVYESGRKRVISEKRKNVHAFVLGKLVNEIEPDNTFSSVKYNPYAMNQFQYEGENIFQAKKVILNGRKVTASK